MEQNMSKKFAQDYKYHNSQKVPSIPLEAAWLEKVAIYFFSVKNPKLSFDFKQNW